MQFSLSGRPAAAPIRGAAVQQPALPVACPSISHSTSRRSHAHQRSRCSQAPFMPSAFGPAAPVRPSRHASVEASASSATAASTSGSSSGIQVVKSELSSTQRRVIITVPARLCQEGFTTAVENMKKIVGKLRGFREGQIPLSMLVTQCGGQHKFKLTVIEEILMSTIPKAMDQVGEAVIQGTDRITSDINDMEKSFDPAKPFTFEMEYETAPPVKWARPYKEAEVTIRDNGNLATDNAAVDALIRQYLKEKGFQRVVVGRGLQSGDTCVMDLTVCPRGSSTPLTGMRRDKFPMDTETDPIGLVKGMLGMAAGETRSFPLRMPSNYVVELWRNVEVDVTVKAHEVFSWALPEFDDEFVKANFGSQFTSAEEMRKGLLASTAMDRVKDLDKQLEDALVEAVVSCMDFPEVPASLVNEMGSAQYRNSLMQMMQSKVASKEDIEALLTEEKVEEYIEKNREELEDLVKFNLAVEDIFATEKLVIDEADIAAEIENQKQQYKAAGNLEYDAAMLREQVLDSFKSVRVIEWLKDNVKRHVVPFQG